MDKVLLMEHTLDDYKIVVENFNQKNGKAKTLPEETGRKQEKSGYVESQQKAQVTNNDHFVTRAHFKKTADGLPSRAPIDYSLEKEVAMNTQQATQEAEAV
jgi:hypothetical protein